MRRGSPARVSICFPDRLPGRLHVRARWVRAPRPARAQTTERRSCDSLSPPADWHSCRRRENNRPGRTGDTIAGRCVRWLRVAPALFMTAPQQTHRPDMALCGRLGITGERSLPVARHAAARQQHVAADYIAPRPPGLGRDAICTRRGGVILRGAPAIFMTAAQHIMGFDIASGGGGVKKRKGAGLVLGHAFAFQQHAAQPNLRFRDAAGGGRASPRLPAFFAAQRGAQRVPSHHGQGRDAPAFSRAQQCRHGERSQQRGSR